MCKDFARTLNKEADSALKIELELSRSPFNGAKQIFSDFCCVSSKKKHLEDTFASDSKYFGLPFGATSAARELFNLRKKSEGRDIRRFYAKLTVLS